MNTKQEIHNLKSKLESIRKKLIKNPKSVRLLHIEIEITDKLKKLGIILDPNPEIKTESKKDVVDLITIQKFTEKKALPIHFNSFSVQKFDRMCSQYK